MALSSDDRLVRKAREGDRGAFEALVGRYQRPAYLAALGVTGSPEDAEDVAQEAFIVALERLDECRDPSRFAGWFLTIVRNRARNYIRRESLRRMEEIPAGTATRGPDPARELESGELRRRLAKAMEGLSEVRRQVVLMHDLEGWKHREIGEVLGIPPGTVRSHLHFARKALREALENAGAQMESNEP